MVARLACHGGIIPVPGVERPACYRHEPTIEANGIGRKFEERAKAVGSAAPESRSLSYDLDSEGFKLVADRLPEQAGVHAMTHRTLVAPVMEGDRIAGISVKSTAGARGDPCQHQTACAVKGAVILPLAGVSIVGGPGIGAIAPARTCAGWPAGAGKILPSCILAGQKP